jgi:nitrous oxide reductase accessory protein NosL
MKRTFLSLAVLCLLLGVAFAMQHDQGASSCQYCGMDLGKFAHSRMQILYDDDTVVNTCSIHCAALDLALNIDMTPSNIMVGDYQTRELIDAEKAHWVIGGDKAGVMSTRAKWAFGEKKDAIAFIKKHGGEHAAFDEAMRAAYTDMYEDTKMIREKRRKM